MTDARYDLRSDTVTRPSDAMLRAMTEAPLGDDVLGDDPTVKRLEATIAERTGKEAGLFFPSGTQANQTAVALHTEPGTEALIEAKAHIFHFEAGAPAALAGVQLHPVETSDGAIRVADLIGMVRPADAHFPRTRLLCLENTHNGHGGRIYPIAEMEAVAEWARERGIAVHLDGARLFNAIAATGVAAGRWAACADTVSICLSKGLGAPVGTCLVGDAGAIEEARWIRKRLGGGMRQAGILAAAGIFALEENADRLADDHAAARAIAEAVAGLDGIAADPDRVETNIVLIGIEPGGITAADLVDALAEESVAILPVGPTTIRAVLHLDVPEDAAEEVPRRFRAALERIREKRVGR
ncbi:MAG: low-specificity L-threonine aldolase [Gemmatimonadota bacterium]|nr:low-specificity L-threonine aldolase [Gemmatimonadota bacterium]